MYFLFIIILVLIIIPSNIERKYPIVLYFKMLIISIIYFYSLSLINKSILYLLLTLIAFTTITILIYRLVYNSFDIKEEDNNLFNLAHEVKNPIAVCKGYLDMLDVNDKDKIKRYLPIIKNEMKRSLTIMDEFLDLKRINLNKDLMDFSLLLDDIKETTEIILKENHVNLNISNIDKELIINGDYDKLKQVLINLIKNSYEAEAKNIKLDIKINNNYLKIKVKDDGKGIAKDDLKRIGEVFYTTKVAGTGVGVSMAKEIVRLHDGNLSYESIINKGTTATIILPIKYIF